jgi:hypothetical protein
LAEVLRQRVQTRAFTLFPPIITVAAWRLGMKRRRVRTFEWLTLLPEAGPLPQIWHCWAIDL